MKYISFVMMFVSLLLLSGCQEQQVVKYLEFNGMKYEEISPDTYFFDGNYIYTVEIGTSVEITFSFIEATMVVQSNGDFNVTYDQGTVINCTQSTCITNTFQTIPYEGEAFRSLSDGVQRDGGSSEPSQPIGMILLTILLVMISVVTLIIGSSFDKTKRMLELFYSLSWRFKGEVEPSDFNVKMTRFNLFVITIFTILWIIFIFF